MSFNHNIVGYDYGSSAGITEGFSMCGGDFVEVYSDSSQVGREKLFLAIFLFYVR